MSLEYFAAWNNLSDEQKRYPEDGQNLLPGKIYVVRAQAGNHRWILPIATDWGHELWQACLMWALAGPVMDYFDSQRKKGKVLEWSEQVSLSRRADYHLAVGIHVLARQAGLT